MRVITITFRENVPRREIETFVDAGNKKDGSETENNLFDHLWPRIIRAMATGSKAIAMGDDHVSEETLRTAAQLDVDIRKAGE
jgi:hypothetical protein